MKVICYLSLGYPSLEGSIEMVDRYFEGGADGVEICIPCADPFLEKDTIKNWMIQSYNEVGDYSVYMDAIKRITAKYPDKTFFVMVYNEVIEAVGPEKFAAFYKEARIASIISANLTPEIVEAMKANNVNMCSFSGYLKVEETLEACKACKGFIYMSTFLRPGQEAKPGFETLDKCIGYMREHGVSCPIYCGGGIKTPDHARMIKAAGADGFFVGTALIDLANEPAKLVKLVSDYKNSVN